MLSELTIYLFHHRVRPFIDLPRSTIYLVIRFPIIPFVGAKIFSLKYFRLVPTKLDQFDRVTRISFAQLDTLNIPR